MAWTDPRKAAAAKAAGTAATPTTSAAPPPPTAGAAAPASLPPVTSAPAQQPAATTTPAASPGRGRRGAAAAAAAQAAAAQPAAQPAPAATQPAATPAPAAQTTVTTAQPQTLSRPIGFLAILTPAAPGKTALNVVDEGVRPAGEPNIFPTIYLTGGDSGGNFEFHDMNPEGSNADLPRGKGQGPNGTDPFPAILMGFRYQVLIWPKAYNKNAPKQSPRSRGIIPYDELEAVNIAQDAVQVYTFRNRQTQDEFDPLGHPTLILELLMYDQVAGIFCVQTTGTYDCALMTGKELLAAFPDGVPQATPVLFNPAKHQMQSKSNTWDEHYIQVRQSVVGAEIDDVKAAFNKFLVEHGSHPDLLASITEWSKFTMTTEAMDALAQIAARR
jgi:hypothetical protein